MCLFACVILTACGHQHTYAAEWTKDATSHWHACNGASCDGIADKAEHAWNDGEITTKPTREADGVKTYTCTVCQQTKTEPVEFVATVTETEWQNAFSIDNFSIVMSAEFGGYIMRQEMLYTPSDIYEMTTLGEESHSFYFTKNNAGTWDYYSPSPSSGYWDHVSYDQSNILVIPLDSLTVLKYFRFVKDLFASAAYNEAEMCYELSDLTYTTMFFSTVRVYFENGNVAKIIYTESDGENYLDWTSVLSNIGSTPITRVPAEAFLALEREAVLKLMCNSFSANLTWSSLQDLLEKDPEEWSASQKDFYDIRTGWCGGNAWHTDLVEIWSRIKSAKRAEDIIEIYNSDFKAYTLAYPYLEIEFQER